MLDERTGLTHDYTCKSGVAEAVILTPATAPAWVYEPCRTLECR